MNMSLLWAPCHQTHPHVYGPDTCPYIQPAGSDFPGLHRLICTDLPWVYSQWLIHPPWSQGRFWWFNWLLELTVVCAAVKVFHRFWGLPRACTVPEDWSIVGWSPMHPRKLIYTSLKKCCSACVMCCVNTLCLTCSISHSLRWSIVLAIHHEQCTYIVIDIPVSQSFT